ncbi:protein Gawky-like [Topomyia yanbarensis]|uniref:protein Gawky-like n=1 Tax=Topomyia yanbarensis TaxID=2498891 RepID=UPI00273CB99C|nr:protein Gawky-like [Topomyia yanbarensis]XP_058815310.1 protein Gawky-like [Topomyia yanbarensis]XP_058815311.1 protein Gawky-like [Topomyia yanbarensis]
MQHFISSIENHTKNLDVLMILNIKKFDKNITCTVTTIATAKSITTTTTTTISTTSTTQNNTNKSEYAFKKSLNSLLSLIGEKTRQELSKKRIRKEGGKLHLLIQKPLLLQSIDESEQQSGIVSDIILTVSINSLICNKTAKLNIDCIAFVVIEEGQLHLQREQRSKLKLAGQYYARSERRPELNTGGYNIQTNQKDGNLTHFDHLFQSTMNKNDTVNMICDLIDYLITVNTNHSIVIDGCSSLICIDQNVDFKDSNDKAMAGDRTDANTSEQAKRTSKLVTTYVKFDELLRMSEWEKTVLKSGVRPRMRLCGGGEDSINSGTSAWGTPAPGNPGNSWASLNPQQPGAWGSNPQAGPTGVAGASMKQQQPNPAGPAGATGHPVGDSTEPNAWSGGNPVNPNNANVQNQPSGASNVGNAINNPNPTQPQQQQQQQQLETPAAQPNPKLERLNTMIEALHAVDGWGSENVNQDSRWDVPASPEPGSKPDPNSAISGPTAGIPMWKTNTGTEIWEANLRNGGQMPQQQPVQKTPWGPSTNIGGTWGEDDDASESNTVWNGATAGTNQTPAVPQGGQPQQPPWNAANNTAMWGPGGPASGAVKKENNDWGGTAGPAAGGWDQRNAPPVGAPNTIAGMESTNIDMRNMRITGGIDGNREIRGDPRGISGRLNGNVNLWDQHQLPGMAPNKIPPVTTPVTPAGGGQWPTNQVPGHNKMPSNWDDSSTQGVRRNVDDGTAMWGQNVLSRQNSNVSNWKEGQEGLQRNSVQRNSIVGGNLPGVANSRLGNTGPIKPDNLWGQNNVGGGGGARGNGGWEDTGSNNWEEKSAGSLWNDNASAGNWNKNKQMGSNWNDANADMGPDWGMHGGGLNKPPNKINPLEFIRNSKQYRMLCEMGFKKEDVETVLRISNMNLEESIEMLQRNASTTDWRRGDDHGPGFAGQFADRFSGAGNSTLPFPPNNQNILSGFGGNPNINSFNNMKFGAGHGGGGPNGATGAPFGQPSVLNQNAQSQPSTQQLRMLVQQIQMAVQHGYLNHQILNQPLAPQTLLLLNQLLNHIKQLQVMQSNLNRSGGGGVSAVQISLAINKLKSQIGNLQNQITAQQTIYVKQQQQQNNPNPVSGAGHPGNDLFRTPNDLSGLPGNFSDMSLKDNNNPFPTSGGTSQQSRLTQWKLPSTPAADKDTDLTDFPRAPGTTSKPSGLGGIDDGTWSNGRSNMGDGWPDSNAQDNKDWAANADAFTDLVPEFEPGKPWKGTQTTRIEDDPTITPGSVARSPLSIASAKDSNLFANSNSSSNHNSNATNSKSSPTESITSSTWSYNPNSTHGSFGGSKLKNAWPDSIVPSADLWDNALGKGGRVAPPGLKGAGGKLDVNGWNPPHGGGAGHSVGGWNSAVPSWPSTWILLKNLTAQIDGSTLRTLCMQHGPLLAFHVYLNHGIALCKYSSREEASKAQLALNNCMLGNATICAETPTESDVQNILQHLGPPSGANGLTGGQSGGQNWRLGAAAQSQSMRNPAADTWSSAWPSSTAGSNLWAPLDGPSDRVTPANLNSFLPESLLGTELN